MAALSSLLVPSRPALAAIQCSFVSTVGVNFGAYDVFRGTPTDSTGSVTYNCRGVGVSTITIDLARGSSSTYNPRQMRNGAQTLNYNLYLDAARSIIWGDNTGGSSHYGPIRPDNNVNTNVTIYGRILAGEDVPMGNYADTITATLNF